MVTAQLSLLEPVSIASVLSPIPASPTLAIVPIPSNLAIEPRRYFFEVTQGDLKWHFPIQFKRWEAERLFPLLSRLNWALDEDEGYPFFTEAIYLQVENWFAAGCPALQRRAAA